ncbi:MAG: hypothetical protein GY727_02735 [Gammaproteobacteria bacterium]|nr:hypothetical protein [Gammaproteobacteria bacterium]MCP4088756.1 hypothetical protein [Gammaproteobacteria bacterium]MCP4275945.1 hypothetical protein [Gammaproteobacteria bacterium]MCP4832161.1 hypothetical protein [Gammaproteobacteria bacterium]MCP4928238.1 hypothetical protein [Gammaproteobacteria bacterium]
MSLTNNATPLKDNETIDDSAFAETAVIEAQMKPTDNVGEASVQLDVESLIADIELEAAEGVDANGRIRRKLDAIMERKRRHEALVDFEDYDTDVIV